MIKDKKELIKPIIIIVVLIMMPFIIIKFIGFINDCYENRDLKLINMSITAKDISLCPKINNLELRNKCFLEIAKKDKNISLCDNLVDTKLRRRKNWYNPMPELLYGGLGYENWEIVTHNNRDNCVQEIRKILIEDALKSSDFSDCKNDEECLYQLTIQLNNSQYCFKFEEKKKNSCFLKISKNKKDIKLCEFINDTNLEKECYYFFSGFIYDALLCELIPEDKIAGCYYNLAINKSNANYCNKTKDREGECFFNIAKNTNNPSYCSDTAGFESQCWNFFALNHSQEKFCELSSDSGICYYDLALQIKKPELCKKAKDKENICFYKFAVMEHEPSYCLGLDSMDVVCPGEILDYSQMKMCRMFDDAVSSCVYLTSTFTSAYCDYISKDYYKHKCYRNVAIGNSDADMCDLADVFMDNCYFEIAIKEKRKDLCEKAGPWKYECLNKLGNTI